MIYKCKRCNEDFVNSVRDILMHLGDIDDDPICENCFACYGEIQWSNKLNVLVQKDIREELKQIEQ